MIRPAYWPDKATHARVWSLAWPMMLSNITVPLLGLVDTAVIGHLPDPHHLGAVAVGSMIFSILYWAFGFLRMGTTGMVAQACGRQDGERIRTLLGQSLVLGVTIGILILLLRTPLTSLALQLMDPEPTVLASAAEYTAIRAFGAPAVLCNFALLGWFVGNQNTRIALILLTSTNLLNMLLDLLFVFGFGMAADGVALATVCAEYFSLLLGLWFCRRLLGHLPGRWIWQQLHRLGDYRELISVNRYLFVRTLLLLMTFAFFTAQGAKQGTTILSANAVLLNFLLLISNALDGFAHATEALTGKALGEKKRSGFYRVLVCATLWSALSACLLTLLFWLGGKPIIHLLTDIPEVRHEAVLYLPWIVILPLIGTWSFLLDGIFIGTTRVKAMQDTMLVSVLLVFAPVWWFSQSLGNQGLWLAFIALFAARGLTGAWVFWRLDRQDAWFSRG
ncbi:MATE family efflux transporter [Marinobacterium sediminicola]|uniref:Multidrug resistance protein, MATE family n=1 Tax=Marinobacterium sediminicola TaxID=518898 RepID=A0ABY1S371_9GAMM|nr:MATE family efflux transporter [Marinobacterium sediminicola]ULG69267.1 MATE family efflux transporter [Marinobacterium sediminicola]SMR77616.1 multidrug resistance protein, MATE family [Marinobacterium sediminicola]